MMIHSVYGGVDGGVIHLAYLTRKVDCCLMERKKQNAGGECQDHGAQNVTKSKSVFFDDSVNVAVECGVDGGVDGGVIHLTHLTLKVDCCLMGGEQNACGECQDHGVPNMTKSRRLLYDSAKLNDGKEVDETMLLNVVEVSVDVGDNHLTYLTQFESNDGVEGCENFTHIAKN
eukprot:15353440-Ditylum_brightwellii.AAC.1